MAGGARVSTKFELSMMWRRQSLNLNAHREEKRFAAPMTASNFPRLAVDMRTAR